ncbi:shikimate kinase [Salegentibacter sp. F188]|uniref:Shikimate kinase n=1 Tax=Autumnicola patrickiae TaxID=3075591 RepID=A0ABU3E7D1_9FLAO|nr:shikimate kinase [Salegentibacter sp. F188]MDT0691544.1 shikimate kinase [Salegentibacter sp. F188]
MKIFLNGYMGAGKSLLGRQLSAVLNYNYVDLDEQIELIEQTDIQSIFKKRGELYFRNLENKVLRDILEKEEDMVVSLGGGTPCYGDNMKWIKEVSGSKTVYLKATVQTLTDRLFLEKVHRPVISHLQTKPELEEFLRKHLFERAYYYNQSEIIVDVDNRDPEQIVNDIVEKL